MFDEDDKSLDTVHKAIIFEDVSLRFEDLEVLRNVSFELKRGETVSRASSPRSS